MNRCGAWLTVGLLAVCLATPGGAAPPLPVAKEAELGREFSAVVKGRGACGKLDSLVKEYLGKGLTLGSIAESAMSACGDLDALMGAVLGAGVAQDVAAQALIFAGGDPVDVASALDQARLSFERKGRALAYTPPPPARGLDRSQQVVPAQFAPTLWGPPVRDAGPDRSRPSISPSSP